MKKSSWLDNIPEGRLISLDVYRGLVMLLLIAEVTGIYDLMVSPSLQGTALYAIGLQFHHHPWHGLRLWDLGQGLFMFISGVAMNFSYNQCWSRGASQKKCFWHAIERALFLFLIGWALYLIYPPEGATSWSFLLDILPMLAFGSLAAFLVLRWTSRWQLAFSGGLLLLTELLYRLWPVSGLVLARNRRHLARIRGRNATRPARASSTFHKTRIRKPTRCAPCTRCRAAPVRPAPARRFPARPVSARRSVSTCPAVSSSRRLPRAG